ncbi:hypothetical protein CCMSSC00406_0006058 [Pleurotus cornucopiae]|uniref:Uncharacterized protein n=1 Tax=Pleurotus cornucopiae TaxID=5321 RepID=A0ACB7INF6_PLECO|nr:hypothetical protein CCMSSC00406_0006058 [Pleurotus cornucopiae]
MTPMIRLPIEIIAEIIAAVVDGTEFTSEDPDFYPGRDEHHPLAAASLVSRTWSTICRPHIFRIISISTRTMDDRLWFLHFEAPHLSEFIHVVHLQCDYDPDTTLAWYPECLGRLKNLRVLHLDSWMSTLLLEPGPLSAGISSMLAAPCLRKLALRGCDLSEDASDLRAMLPVTLKELVLEGISATSDIEGKTTSTPRLEALRSLKLQEIYHPMFRLKNFIECPNLDRLSAHWYSGQPWDLPPWVPSSLSELVLCGMSLSSSVSDCNIPDFGTAIQPSVVEINQSGDTSYLELFMWIKDCIRNLPFPTSIRTLTLDIENIKLDCDDHPEDISPSLSEYGMLSHFLLQLYEEGGLKGIILNITASVGSSDPKSLCVDEAQELAKLKIGFAPLLKENILDVDFIMSSWAEGGTTWHSSIQRVKHASHS